MATGVPTIATAAPTNVPSPLPTPAPTLTTFATMSLPTLAPTILASDESLSNGGNGNTGNHGNGNNGNNGNGNGNGHNQEDEDDEGPKFIGHEIPLSAWRTIDGNIRPGTLYDLYDIVRVDLLLVGMRMF